MPLLRNKQLLQAPKDSARVATTAPLPANTRAAGTNPAGQSQNTHNGTGSADIGATLTGTGNGALTVDGVLLVGSSAGIDGDLVLVKNEVSAFNNGLYKLTQQGTVALPYILTRMTTADTDQKISGAVVGVVAGAVNGGKVFMNTNDIVAVPIVWGTTAITWEDNTALQVQPNANNKNMAALATTGDAQQASATAIAATPAGYVQVFVNGEKVNPGGAVTGFDCFFGPNATTPHGPGAIVAGDFLWWVGSIAGFQLATTDLISFDYSN